MKRINNYEDFTKGIPKDGNVHFESLHDLTGKALALVHFITPIKDRIKYMDVDVYKVRTWDKETSNPDKIQFVFSMSSKYDGGYTITFTDSPVSGKDQADLENFYSLIPYVYNITPDKIVSNFTSEGSDQVH